MKILAKDLKEGQRIQLSVCNRLEVFIIDNIILRSYHTYLGLRNAKTNDLDSYIAGWAEMINVVTNKLREEWWE